MMNALDADIGGPVIVTIYGPPRSLRGRLANRIRRWLHRPEREEAYWTGWAYHRDAPPLSNRMRMEWDSAGTFTIHD